MTRAPLCDIYPPHKPRTIKRSVYPGTPLQRSLHTLDSTSLLEQQSGTGLLHTSADRDKRDRSCLLVAQMCTALLGMPQDESRSCDPTMSSVPRFPTRHPRTP